MTDFVSLLLIFMLLTLYGIFGVLHGEMDRNPGLELAGRIFAWGGLLGMVVVWILMGVEVFS